MGPAAWRSGSPRRSPSASPGIRAAEQIHAPEAPRQCPWEIRTLRRAEGLGVAAAFAASGVTSGVKGEGGATPSIARDLDPAPCGAGRPAGVAPPSSTAENRITQRHDRDLIVIASRSRSGRATITHLIEDADANEIMVNLHRDPAADRRRDQPRAASGSPAGRPVPVRAVSYSHVRRRRRSLRNGRAAVRRERSTVASSLKPLHLIACEVLP